MYCCVWIHYEIILILSHKLPLFCYLSNNCKGHFVDSYFLSNRVLVGEQEAIDLLRESHNLLADEPDDFEIMTQLELMQMTGQITGILTILLAAVASISLLVGGIGIMNIMLVSVTEGTREIGVRLALGARESDILTQFLIKAISLSAAGGVLGIGLGILGNFIIYKTTKFYIPTSYLSIIVNLDSQH